jgi:hypothetical protein
MAERTHRPLERFWPYVEKPEEPTDEELAALDPDLHEALFGRRDTPFSVTLVFGAFGGDTYARAVGLAKLRELFELVGPQPGTDVLIDDRPLPYSRELWLPLIWFLLLD